MPFSTRLSLALEAGLLLPEGPVGIWGADVDSDVSALVAPQIISQDARVHAVFRGAHRKAEGPLAAACVILPRARKEAQALIAEAAAATSGPLIVDGQKTDGIDPIVKALKKRGDLMGPISKAHGKLCWLETPPDLSDWAAQPSNIEGFKTLPGVFSADHIDPGSAALAKALPANLGKSIADLGAGWGWLSAQVISPEREVHMVEADGAALECAIENVPEAKAHWADVLTWHEPMGFDTVIMNPPFHHGRKGTPELGQAFIEKAAKILKPAGQLFMVANRHLPYEATLNAQFTKVTELAGDGRFKVFQAARPKRIRR